MEEFDFSQIVKPLCNWYDENKRSMSWRDDPTPYHVWVSEIMLQQTRIEAAKAYYDRFMQALPDIASLAKVEEEKLLKLWEGLGYYNRARNLQKTAIEVMEHYQGELPKDYHMLIKLPGIGPYTAGAIASIAYQVKAPAVDGNVLRVTMRIAGCFEDIMKASLRKKVEQALIKVIPEERPGDFNQAVMELGETICIPNGEPICCECPLKEHCAAFKNQWTSQLPVKAEKKARKIEEKTIFVIEADGYFAIQKRKEKGLLAGLWEFPSIMGKSDLSQVRKQFEKEGYRLKDAFLLGDAKHIFSHVEWHMNGFYLKLESKQSTGDKDGLLWVTKRQLREEYTIPVAYHAFLKQILG